MSNTTQMPETPNQMDAFQIGTLNGRKDVIILLMGFMLNNDKATRDEIWEFVMRIDDIIKENPTAGIVELSALAKLETHND